MDQEKMKKREKKRKRIKFAMFGFNVVFWLTGVAMVGVGVWVAVDPHAFDSLDAVESAGMDNDLWVIGVYTFIGIGALVFFVGFLGCWGAVISRNSSVPLWIYSVMVVICIMGEIAVSVLIGIYWSSADNIEVKEAMKNDSYYRYQGEHTSDALSTAWNTMQQEWECCGSNGPEDYRGSLYDNKTMTPNDTIIIPETCCVSYNGGKGHDNPALLAECQKMAPGSGNFYKKGCYDALVEFLDQCAPLIIGLACGFAGLQIIGLILACCLIHKKPERDKEKHRPTPPGDQ